MVLCELDQSVVNGIQAACGDGFIVSRAETPDQGNQRHSIRRIADGAEIMVYSASEDVAGIRLLGNCGSHLFRWRKQRPEMIGGNNYYSGIRPIGWYLSPYGTREEVMDEHRVNQCIACGEFFTSLGDALFREMGR